ncbi:DNA pilot protein [Tortoise microvirus 89]|nr:DNA pilot protein [Tortoise microvirus 89]
MAVLSTGAGMAIAAGASALSAGGQIYAAGKMNKKTREWNEKMYGQQRADALADWRMQNEYNSPAAQMQRLKAAGLNPNLVYNDGATHTAAAVRSTDSKSWNPTTPDIAGLSSAAIQGIQAYQDITLQQEQVKNMEAQRRNMALDSILKSAELASKQITNARGQLELAKARDLYDTSISTANEELRAMRTGTDIRISEEARRAALHAPNLITAIERAMMAGEQRKSEPVRRDLMRAQIENLRSTNVLQALEIKLREKGLSYNDSLVARFLSRLVDGTNLSDAVKDFVKDIDDYETTGDALDGADKIHKEFFRPFKGLFHK